MLLSAKITDQPISGTYPEQIFDAATMRFSENKKTL